MTRGESRAANVGYGPPRARSIFRALGKGILRVAVGVLLCMLSSTFLVLRRRQGVPSTKAADHGKTGWKREALPMAAVTLSSIVSMARGTRTLTDLCRRIDRSEQALPSRLTTMTCWGDTTVIPLDHSSGLCFDHGQVHHAAYPL